MNANFGTITCPCPTCPQTRMVQAVRAVVDAGTSTGIEVRQTMLAQQLSRPIAPRYKSPWGGCSISFCIVIAFGCLVGMTVGGRPNDIAMGSIWLGVIGAVIVYKMYESSRRRAQVEAEIPRWQLADQRWNRLYYCHSCGNVFNPGISAYVPANQMHRLL